MRLYIIRHAEPDYPNNTITEQGHREAKALADRMAGERLDRIYSSPLGRAMDTMRCTSEHFPCVPAIEDWTRELSIPAVDMDQWGKMAIWNLPGEIIRGRETFPTHDDWLDIESYGGPGVRSLFEELKAGSDAFLARHGYERVGGRYRCVQPNRERIAVFCHGGFGLAWLAHLLEIPLPLVWSGFFLAPSSVTTVLMEQRSDEWAVPRCFGLSDVSHLHIAGLPVSTSGVVADNW